MTVSLATNSAAAPFGGVAGKPLSGVDGSTIALNLIDGGLELQIAPPGGGLDSGMARKTTFTFMTDRMGTVVEDSGTPGAGTSVTGFFRLTSGGVEVRYADGRSAMLSANADGGVQMALDGEGASCRAWYPAGHVFSDSEKKAALNAYASRLGLAVAAGDNGNGCGAKAGEAAAMPAALPQAAPKPKPLAEARAVKVPARMNHYRIGDHASALQAVSVKSSEVHLIDTAADADKTVPAIAPVTASVAAPDKPKGSRENASNCLSIGSDGGHWGFRNACDFAVQFAYCTAEACSSDVNRQASGSVAANGFGALIADKSLAEQDVLHRFRWIACGGGAGEVTAHLEHAEPVSGRCERIASN
jgi:hypothetical protein